MAIARTITNNGLKELTKLHAAIVDPTKKGKPFEYIGVGKGSATPMVTDTGLQDEIKLSNNVPNRKKAVITTDPDVTGDPDMTTVMYTSTWNPGEIASGNDEVPVQEVALFNGPDITDVMYYRETRGVLTISGTVGLTIKIRCKFSRIV